MYNSSLKCAGCKLPFYTEIGLADHECSFRNTEPVDDQCLPRVVPRYEPEDRPFEASKPESEPKSFCAQAQEVVGGDRQRYYGHPLDNFENVAKIWSIRLGKEITPEDVAWCMIALKLSREANAPKDDNWVDMCGYAEALWEARQERTRREQVQKSRKP